VIAALKRICLSRVFRSQKVVGHRDHGEKDEDEKDQRDDLQSPALSLDRGTRSTPQPQANQSNGDKRAREIEE
jgi:hypothetical protein